MSFKSTFDPKAVSKKHKEIEKKFQAIADAMKAAGVNDPEINDILALHFSSQLDAAINGGKFVDAIGVTITEPDETF